MMPRNLDKRVELMFPIEDADIKARVIATLRDEWRDNVKAWEMKKSGIYRRVRREEPLLNVQEARIMGQAMPEDLSPLLDDDDIEKIDRRDREEFEEYEDDERLPPDSAEYGDTMELEHESDYSEQEADALDGHREETPILPDRDGGDDEDI